MTRILIGATDVEDRPEVSTPYERQATGRDQLLAKDADAVAWLAKVFGEMQAKSRDWSIFDQRRLGAFLDYAGVDLEKATKDHGDTMPPPRSVGDLEQCCGTLRGASFLNVPEQEACLLIEQVSQRSPHRR